MGMKLGLAVTSMAVVSLLPLARPATAGPVPAAPGESTTTTTSTTVPDTSSSTTTTSTTTTTTTTTTTSTTTTTTTAPGAVVGGVGIDPPTAAPRRSDTQVVINPPPPPPTTTTTTVPPPPPPGALPLNSGSGRRAVYSKSQQMVWAVDSNGVVLKSHRVSGKQLWCDPRVGSYQVYSRSRYTFALQNPSIIWGYMVRFAKGCQGGNIGFHEIPVNKNTGWPVQSVSQLGQPLSGGCVRQAIPDAIWMWNWAYIGTKVVVLP